MSKLNPNIALVVLSGGQDSVTCLHWAKAQGFEELHAITFNYGQRHSREVMAAALSAEYAGVRDRHYVVNVPNVLESTSPLVSANERLETYADAKQMAEVIGDRVEKTFVPMRNTLFLALAANKAVAIGAGTIITGVCQEDNANYPDCTQAFVDSMQRLINVGLGLTGALNEIQILAPLMNKSKAETVKLALQLGNNAMLALAYSHTAYSGEYPPITQDHATVLRAQGFLEANVPDPLIVRAWGEGKMQLPRTPNYQSLIDGTEVSVVYEQLIEKAQAELKA